MTLSTKRTFAVLLAFSLALGPSVARADTAVETRAKALYKEGMKAYDVGDFEGGLRLYSEAYKLTQLPGFLFNIAQCHRQLGNYEQAAFFYGRFIDNSKLKAPNVELASQLLAEMKSKQTEKLAAEHQKADDAARTAEESRKAAADAPKLIPPVADLVALPPPPPPPMAEAQPIYKSGLFWTVIGVAVAGLAAGTAAAVVAGSKSQGLPTTQDPIGTPH